jgi:hypothetical protein
MGNKSYLCKFQVLTTVNMQSYFLVCYALWSHRNLLKMQIVFSCETFMNLQSTILHIILSFFFCEVIGTAALLAYFASLG